MWEGIQKNEKMLEADERFIVGSEKTIGRKDSAPRSLQLGWKFLLQDNDPNMAIKRFNQAWLLDESNPNIYWGYAVATHRQGMPLSVVERHFSKAEEGFKPNKMALADLYSDYGRVLGERGDIESAKQKFERALTLNPNNKNANLGMASMLEAQGNNADAKKFWEAAK